ncbi:methyl-accepting chemotaxis protein [Gracilibacillus halophilus YIM-C55.5]|uniref:Methyl-accepting chemotaxis protein n=1 Tax=Gracilibacillus halophilus YIM-C55.5 TaxID=1308866 RepID=N4WNT7_9BACI|nr:methyl-accepting chemotaxis protein [Gracilibacillus halophilus]ENH96145.1 methyl-accepting chemotaxis protein [Gracilibacillus halophilus YIM-C55.5]
MKILKKIKNLRAWLSFRHLKVGKKYGLILLIVLSLFLISTIVVSLFLQDINNEIETLERRGDRAVDVTKMGSSIKSKSIIVHQLMNDENSSSDEITQQYNEQDQAFQELADAIKPRMNTEEENRLFSEINRLNDKVNQNFDEAIQFIESGDRAAAEIVAMRTTQIQNSASRYVQQLEDIVNNQRGVAVDNATQSQTTAFIVLIVAIAVSIVISVLLIMLVSRVVTKNLNRVVEMSNDVAAGDLREQHIDYQGKDEIGQLANAMNTMRNSLKSMMEQITSVSKTVNDQSDKLYHASSEATEGMQQISTTMEELATGAEKQANHSGTVAQKANEFVDKVSEASNEGENLQKASQDVIEVTNDGKGMMNTSISKMRDVDGKVKDAVSKMEGLNEQTDQITKLINVIKDIADQTNLLALNATIESARAGESGKGFAVVAEEVRKLSEQVTNSIQDITTNVGYIQNESAVVMKTLKDSNEVVDEGSQYIEKTGEIFTDINSNVNQMVDKIEKISSRLSEISSGSQDINQSIEEVASISEESAAGVEETTASAQQARSSVEEISSDSETLAKLSEELNQLLRKFKI